MADDEDAFSHQLTNEPAAARAERRAQGNFLPARRRARQQQIRHVRARDQQDDGDGAQQHHQRTAGVADDFLLQGAKRRAEAVAIVAWMIGLERRRHGVEIRLGLLAADAGLQARERRIAVRAAIVVAQRLGIEKERLPDLDAPIGKLERGRHHANHLRRTTIHRNRLPDDRRVRAEPPRPQRMTQHHDVVAAWLILVRDERAADLRGRAEQREERRGHDGAFDALGLAAAGEIESDGVVGRHLLEGMTSIAIVHVLPGGGRDVVEPRTLQVAPDHHESIRVAVRKRPQQHAVDDGKDGGVGTDAEREGEQHDDREPRIPAQGAEGITHVGGDQLRPQPGSPRSNGVHVVGHRAERVVVRRAGGAQLAVLIVEVLAKLLGDVVWPLRHVPLR